MNRKKTYIIALFSLIPCVISVIFTGLMSFTHIVTPDESLLVKLQIGEINNTVFSLLSLLSFIGYVMIAGCILQELPFSEKKDSLEKQYIDLEKERRDLNNIRLGYLKSLERDVLRKIIPTKEEYIVCSAIWYKEQTPSKIAVPNIDKGLVVCGHRHGHCIHTFLSLTGKRTVIPECGDYEQGFLTSKNRFVSREEAAEIAYNVGQIIEKKETLYSEDIY